MYLRPGNLVRAFVLERKTETIEPTGRVRAEYDTENTELIYAVLAQASPRETERWQQLQHPITHIMTQRGRSKAREGDRLVHNNRTFYVQGVDDPDEIGAATLYYVEERNDVNADNHNGQFERI